ncbi:MAG: metalloregulator ArsR/SmtB family transcription factor [Chitinophagaceae bacterium]
MRRDSFQAIADPTRRQILGMVAKQSLNINAVAENFEVSRTAVYKHIKILTECGLVVIRQRGRERYCEAKMKNLHVVADWVAQYRLHWEDRLDALDKYLLKIQKPAKQNRNK